MVDRVRPIGSLGERDGEEPRTRTEVEGHLVTVRRNCLHDRLELFREEIALWEPVIPLLGFRVPWRSHGWDATRVSFGKLAQAGIPNSLPTALAPFYKKR